jgi:hypothetical protein
VWRVKLVAELRPGVVTEPEVACIERDEQAGLADLGLRLAETKQITAALQAEIVPTQVAVVGEQRRYCSSCARQLATTTAGFMRHVCREVIPHGDAIGCPGLDGGPKQVFGSDCAAVWASQPMVPPSAQANTVRSA